MVTIHTHLSITISLTCNNTTLIPVFYIRNALCFDKVTMLRKGGFLVQKFYCDPKTLFYQQANILQQVYIKNKIIYNNITLNIYLNSYATHPVLSALVNTSWIGQHIMVERDISIHIYHRIQ